MPNLSIEELNSPDRHYSAAMDSVTLINTLVARPELHQDEKDTITRNVKHLEIMVAKDYWTEAHDLTPFNNAIASGLAKIS
jgi:hypothetical protein